MKKVGFCVLLLLMPVLVLAVPHEECGNSKKDCAGCHSMTIQEAGSMLKDVGEVKQVKVATIPGLFELTLENKGKQAVVYMDFAKKHLVTGPVFDIATKKQIGAAANQPTKPTTVKAGSIPAENSIVMGNPEGKKKLFVFTDPECPYCGKLHHELVKLMYMEPDLAIYVKMFPLKMHPKAYDKARVILSAENPQYLLDKAFAGEQLPSPGPKDSPKAVDDTIRLAESLGITATPTLVLPDGRIMPGYREAGEIKKLLSQTK